MRSASEPITEQGLRVNVNDLNLDNLAALKSGRLPFIEYGAGKLLTDALRDQRLSFTSKPGEISGSGPVIVTIGTPVDEFLNPERQVIQDCIDVLLPHLRDGQILLLHDGEEGCDRTQTAEALAAILSACKQRGLTPVTVSEIVKA